MVAVGRFGVDDPEVVAILDGDWMSPSESERLANGRLIAAAPELLAALKEIYATLEKHEPPWYTLGMFNRIGSAIAKAEGK